MPTGWYLKSMPVIERFVSKPGTHEGVGEPVPFLQRTKTPAIELNANPETADHGPFEGYS